MQKGKVLAYKQLSTT